MTQKTPAIEVSVNLVHWVFGFHLSFDDQDDGMILIGLGPLSIAIAKPRCWGMWMMPFMIDSMHGLERVYGL